MHPALLYVPGRRLSLSELSAARLDGLVVEIGDAYIPADLPESADVRASSLAPLVRPGTAAAGPTAAWIHGAGDAPPVVHHIRRSVARRVRPHVDGRVVFHDGALRPDEVVRLGGIDVAMPVRTMLDLATGMHRDPRLLEWIERLAAVDPTVVDASIQAMQQWNRVPGSRIAREVLERLILRRS